jgi:RimJ/RimL family protein N-acetyltransferase
MPTGHRSWPLALDDETTVELRTVQPEDARALATGYQQLSEHSAYTRFHTLYAELSLDQLDYFTRLDHHDHEAIGAVLPGTDEGLGIARYVRDTDDPTHAEVAVTVVDAWQGRGLGEGLLDALARRAREEGVTCFTADVLSDNLSMLGLMRHVGTVTLDRDAETTIAHVDLREDTEKSP